MGVRNYLIEGVSGTGKTSICEELERRGYHAVHGDRELAYQGDPQTGEPLPGASHEHHIWNVSRLREMTDDQSHPATFFCGGSRNFHQFIHVFDMVFVLTVSTDTLRTRLDQRPSGEWGSQPSERALIEHLHRTRQDTPRDGIVVDADPPLAQVVDHILDYLARADDGPAAND